MSAFDTAVKSVASSETGEGTKASLKWGSSTYSFGLLLSLSPSVIPPRDPPLSSVTPPRDSPLFSDKQLNS